MPDSFATYAGKKSARTLLYDTTIFARLAWLGSRIVGAVHDEHRYAQLVKTVFVEVFVRCCRDIHPRAAARANDGPPVVLAVFLRELAGDALAETVRVALHLQEEIA